MEKMLPHKIDAEKAVLGSILIDPEAITIVADILTPDDFYREVHQTVYRAMLHVYERHEPPDILTVSDELERTGKLAQVEDACSLVRLINDVPTSVHAEHYARSVARAAEHRRLIEVGQRIVEAGMNEEDDALELAESLVYSINNRNISQEVSRAGDVFNDFFDQLDTLPNGGSIVGIPSGFHALDSMTRGFQRSDLLVLAGRPAMGKTALALTVARNAAIQYKCGVLLFSLEMSKRQLIQRLAGMEAGINVQRVFTRQLDDDEMDRLIKVAGTITDAPLWIDDTPGLTLTALRSKIRRLMAKEQIDMVIIDYLQLLHATIDGKRIKDRTQEVSEIARELKNVAREFNVPVLALAQLSRAVESRSDNIPHMSDLRESGEIEQAADMVMFIYRDDYYKGYDKQTGRSLSDRPKTADIIIAKHRNGPVGEVVLGFEASQTKFMDYETLQMLEGIEAQTR